MRTIIAAAVLAVMLAEPAGAEEGVQPVPLFQVWSGW